MIRVLGIGFVVMGSVLAAPPAHAEDGQDEASVYLPPVTPDRLYRGTGVRPVSEVVPPAVDAGRPALTEEEVDESCPSVGDDFRTGRSSRSRGRTYPPRPCFVNDQYEPQWYVAPIIGFQDQPKQTVNWEGTGFRIEPQGGPQGGVALGWATGPTWLGRNRVEIELAARSNDFDGLKIDNVVQPASGDISTISGMVNYYWDFKHPDRDWYPYVGVGVGAARMKFNSMFPPFYFKDDDDNTDGVFAYQAMAGVSYRLRSYVEVFAEARYFSTSSADFTTTTPGFTTPLGIVIPAGERKLSVDFHSGGIMAGARIILGKRRCVDGVPSMDGRPTTGSTGWRFRPFN